MKKLLINNQIGRGKIESKSCEMITTNKTNHRSHNLSKLNINNQLK
ncbi:hypothetical protein J4429_04825 [Candidatus Pacearchaeota archaeon]|nr:hypothetical protein [Candidatus Pacearchaeota archaeon]